MNFKSLIDAILVSNTFSLTFPQQNEVRTLVRRDAVGISNTVEGLEVSNNQLGRDETKFSDSKPESSDSKDGKATTNIIGTSKPTEASTGPLHPLVIISYFLLAIYN